jgi:adenosylhomocysteine nucleosidase
MMKKPKTETVSGITFHLGKIHGKRVAVAKCGVGKVFAALCAEAMIIKDSPSLIITSGVGGAINEKLKPGDVVIASSLVQHDMDTSPLGDPKGLISGINVTYFNSCERAVNILRTLCENQGVSYTVGTVATGDKFIASAEDRAYLKEQFGADCCEMECAAIAHAALVNGVSFAVVRAISDSANGDATVDYPSFLARAASASASITSLLIKNY